MRLFDEAKIENLDYKNRNQCSYEYLNKSYIEEVIKKRNLLEEIFKKYPNNQKKEIKRRLMSNENFESTLFEMYLYNVFDNKGFDIVLHPCITNITTKPDFLISKNNIEIYVEATICRNKSNEDQKKENKIRNIIDNINKINGDNYRISINELYIKSEKQPKIIGFKNYIIGELNKLEKNDYSNESKLFLEDIKDYEYEDDDIIISGDIAIVDNLYSDKRFIYMNSYVYNKLIDTSNSLRKSINKKKNRYGNLMKPFIIAINSLDIFTDEEEIMMSVFGDKEIIIDNENRKHIMIKNNGVFSLEKEPRNENISAILFYSMGVGNIEKPKYWLVENPNAQYPIESNIIGLKSISSKDYL